MKREFSALLTLILCVLNANAQLKVDSIGGVCIGGQNVQPNAMLTVGNSSGSHSMGKIAVFSRLTPSISSTTDNVIGVYSNVWGLSNDTKRDIGVVGHVGNGNSGKSYGLIGSIGFQLNGAGIYATAGGYGSAYGETLPGKYAGYFAGPTYVNGTLTATEIISPSDVSLKENIVSIIEEEERTGSSTLDNLMNVNVVNYNYKAKEYVRESEDETIFEDEDLTPEAEENAKLSRIEMSEQRHYGVIAQELQEVYPDLVRKSQDGTLGVNYVEIVPILIRSIQELKSEVDELKTYMQEAQKNRKGSRNVMSSRQKNGNSSYLLTLDGKPVGLKNE